MKVGYVLKFCSGSGTCSIKGDHSPFIRHITFDAHTAAFSVRKYSLQMRLLDYERDKPKNRTVL